MPFVSPPKFTTFSRAGVVLNSPEHTLAVPSPCRRNESGARKRHFGARASDVQLFHAKAYDWRRTLEVLGMAQVYRLTIDSSSFQPVSVSLISASAVVLSPLPRCLSYDCLDLARLARLEQTLSIHLSSKPVKELHPMPCPSPPL